MMACASQEGNLFHKCKELLLFFSFFDNIRQKPGGLFTISAGQVHKRPTDARKVEPKKGRENQNILLPAPPPNEKNNY